MINNSHMKKKLTQKVNKRKVSDTMEIIEHEKLRDLDNTKNTIDTLETESSQPEHPKMGLIHEADHYMKGNEYILRGYRLNFNSGYKIIKSLFMIHNESINVWTHLLGAIFVFILLFYTALFFHHHREIITNFDFSKLNNELTDMTQPIFPT